LIIIDLLRKIFKSFKTFSFN